MTCNTTQSNQCDETAHNHRQTTGLLPEQLREQVEPLALYFETRTTEGWRSVTVETTEYTEADLQQYYGPVRNVTELVSVDAIAEVLDDAN